MNWFFPDVDGIKRVQRDLIDTYGGSHGIRDEGLLVSAVMRAENKVNFDETATVPTVGASLAFGLIKNHAFIDGNKRIGLAALVNFLHLNGYRLTAPVEERIAIVQRTAASELNEQQWTEWVERNAVTR